MPQVSSYMLAAAQKTITHGVRSGVVCAAFSAALSSLPVAAVGQSSDTAAGNAPIHDLAIFFTSKGWFDCVRRANQVASFLGGQAPGQVFIVSQPSESAGLVGVTLLVPRDNDFAVGEMVFALGASGCPASYTIEDTNEMTCPERVSSSDKVDFVELGDSGHFVSQLSPGVMVRLSPTPTGCVRVQTEIISER